MSKVAETKQVQQEVSHKAILPVEVIILCILCIL